VHSNHESGKQEPQKSEDTKDLREANENIRKSQGDDATGPTDSRKTGNKPAFDRDR
jgi:hypothetical protein